MTQEPEPIDDEPTQPLERKQAVANPGVEFRCPHCDRSSWIPGIRALVHIGHGGRLQLPCNGCGGPVEVWSGEQSSIVKPGQFVAPGPNRQQRRAQNAQRKIII